jgi:lipopolysaccharide export LptBFGC system permease protein LptF
MSSQMEMLSSNFNSLITQYTETNQNLINAISSSDPSFNTVPNSSFVGTNLNTIQNSTESDCVASCSSTQSCSGATFDNQQNTCVLNSGNGDVVTSQNQIAIINQVLYYSLQLQKINSDLTTVNNSMMNLVKTDTANYNKSNQNSSHNTTILQTNYNTLDQERTQIDEMVREYETLNASYENGNINVTSNYYYYIVYLLISILLFFLLFKFSVSGGEQSGGGSHSSIGKINPLIFLLLAVIILINSFTKSS